MSQKSNTMWGGRFSSSPAEIMQEINASIDYDKRLFHHDIQGSLAHVAMLAKCKIISDADATMIKSGLKIIEEEIQTGNFDFKQSLEDIHMNIESRLQEIIGDAAGKLHTARSRNDQVATDIRLWLRDACSDIEALIKSLLSNLLQQADEHAEVLMPGYTHLQVAQPIVFGHHLLAYVEMFGRDLSRFGDAKKRMNELPLGSAALAGTGFPIDRDYVASALGFDSVMRNSMDAVSSRDFILEFLSAAVIHSVHLSRLAEEIILWSSSAFSFIKLSDSFTTGSSIMPQKRNADAAELVRAKAGVILGQFVSLSAIMKALPMAYAKDMQEDKVPLFTAVDSLALAVRAMAGMVSDMEVLADNMLNALGEGFPTATDLADSLVRDLGMSFREAHGVCGELVALAESRGVGLEDLSLVEMRKVCGGITEAIFDNLALGVSVGSRDSFGGTAPQRVRAAIIERKKWLGDL